MIKLELPGVDVSMDVAIDEEPGSGADLDLPEAAADSADLSAG